MESEAIKKAKEIVKKYPEVFESLAEYDITRKISKIYKRKRLNITIDENILRDFKHYCEAKGLNMSRLLEKKMLEEMKK